MLGSSTEWRKSCFPVDYADVKKKKNPMLLFEEMGEDSIQPLQFQWGQGERATTRNLSTKPACCCLAWLDILH